MHTVTVSPKFQVVIPKEVREKFGLQVGQKLQVVAFEDRLEFVPIRNPQAMRGFLKGMDTRIEREKDRL